MRLDASEIHPDPGAARETIANALSDAQGHDDPVVTLARSEREYIEASWTDKGYRLQYQDAGAHRYRIGGTCLTLDQVRSAFLEYLANDDAWKHKYAFEKENRDTDGFDEAGRVAGRVIGRAVVKGLRLAREFKKGFDEGKK